MAKRIISLKEGQTTAKFTSDDCLEDEMILEFVCKALIEESFLKNCSIYGRTDGKLKTARESLYKIYGRISVSVIKDEILLEGYVINLTQKRLAEALAWWIPGIRNVVNKLEVMLQKSREENDNEISDAVRMVLEKDPLINADQIQINTLNFTVLLEGRVQTETQKELAENDVLHTIGVEKVVNRLIVQN